VGHIQLYPARNVLRVMEGTGAMENADGQIINANLVMLLIHVLIVMLMIQTVI